jgi:hypothetical protein
MGIVIPLWVWLPVVMWVMWKYEKKKRERLEERWIREVQQMETVPAAGQLEYVERGRELNHHRVSIRPLVFWVVVSLAAVVAESLGQTPTPMITASPTVSSSATMTPLGARTMNAPGPLRGTGVFPVQAVAPRPPVGGKTPGMVPGVPGSVVVYPPSTSATSAAAPTLNPTNLPGMWGLPTRAASATGTRTNTPTATATGP